MDFIKVVKWFLMLLKVPITEDTGLEILTPKKFFKDY